MNIIIQTMSETDLLSLFDSLDSFCSGKSLAYEGPARDMLGTVYGEPVSAISLHKLYNGIAVELVKRNKGLIEKSAQEDC